MAEKSVQQNTTPAAQAHVPSVTITQNQTTVPFDLRSSVSIPQNNKLTLEILKKLPKAELHCHLDGSARISSIIELAKEQGVELPTFDEEELRKIVCVDHTCQSLEQYLRGFEITLRVLQKPYALTRVMYEVCEDAHKDGVRYLEVRFSPILHTKEGLSLSTIMEAVIQGQHMAEYNLNIIVRVIVCGMRQLPPEVTKDLAEIAWRYRHKGVAGFDLAGPEEGFSSKIHEGAFDIVRRKLVNCTLHSGEASGPESIQDSIRYCGAHRIGHGTSLIKSPTLMNFVRDRRIALECCVTSNLHTKSVPSIEAHPIRKFFNAGVIVVPCCDNTTVSSVTLSGEYFLIQNTFDFGLEEMLRMIDYGFSAAFVSVSTKQRLRIEALKKALEVLEAHDYDTTGLLTVRQFDDIGMDLTQLAMHSGLTPKVKRVNNSPGATSLFHTVMEPPITIDVIKALPKTDLHCRFDGSVSLATVWKEIKQSKVDLQKHFGLKEPVTTFQEFQKLIQPGHHSDHSRRLAKSILKYFLQTEEQLVHALQDIMQNAAAENVRYMEIVIRPKTHTKKGLTTQKVLDIIINTKIQMEEQFKRTNTPIKAGIIVYVSTNVDDPIEFRKAAELVVEYQGKGVFGFGVFGEEDVSADAMKYFKSTFDYLKSYNINVVMFSGKHNEASIAAALHEGGACRISGAFSIHKYPRVMAYLALHKIPIELNLTEKLIKLTEEIQTFADPIRLLLDNSLPVTICSFRSSLERTSRSEYFFNVVETAKLSLSETLNLLGNGFLHNFQPYSERADDFARFRKFSTHYLKDLGFKNFYGKHYFKWE